jgi:chromosome partitioning protein
METELNDREAFRAVFSFRQPLAGLDLTEVANLDKAQANVEDFALEILSLTLRGVLLNSRAERK